MQQNAISILFFKLSVAATERIQTNAPGINTFFINFFANFLTCHLSDVRYTIYHIANPKDTGIVMTKKIEKQYFC